MIFLDASLLCLRPAPTRRPPGRMQRRSTESRIVIQKARQLQFENQSKSGHFCDISHSHCKSKCTLLYLPLMCWEIHPVVRSNIKNSNQCTRVGHVQSDYSSIWMIYMYERLKHISEFAILPIRDVQERLQGNRVRS